MGLVSGHRSGAGTGTVKTLSYLRGLQRMKESFLGLVKGEDGEGGGRSGGVIRHRTGQGQVTSPSEYRFSFRLQEVMFEIARRPIFKNEKFKSCYYHT